VKALTERTPAIVSCREEDYTGELELGLDILTLAPLSPSRVRAELRQRVANGGVAPELGEQIFRELAGDAGLAGIVAKFQSAGATEEEFRSLADPHDHKEA